MLSVLAFIRRHWRPLAGALAMLAVIGAVLLYGSRKYDRGVHDERTKHAAAAVDAAESRGQVDQAVAGLPDGSAADELRRDYARD